MLSVLIPVYNWDVSKLVGELHRQCVEQQIYFEILVVDDCSTDVVKKQANEQINLPNFRHISLEKNVGNAEARNILARTAKYNWLLFLDADMIPVRGNFVSLYLAQIQQDDFDIMSGGILYEKEVAPKFRLKWLHGSQTEEQIEKKDPYLEIRGNNFLVRKEIFLQNPFGGLPESYGYVDTHFGLKLKDSQARVKIIDNPCYHLGLETNETFVKKYRKSVRNALWLYHNHPEMADNLRLIQSYKKVRKVGMKKPIGVFFNLFEPLLLRNLYSKNPSLFIFQIYKLGYICTLKAE